MSGRLFSIIVNEILVDGDICLVRGRCDQGPILLGDTFAEYYTVKFDRAGEDAKEVRLHSEKVNLKVESILSYRKLISELSSGWSGELRILGALPTLREGVAIHVFEGRAAAGAV